MRNRPTFATSFAAFSEARPDLTQLAGKLLMKMDNLSYVSTPSHPYARSDMPTSARFGGQGRAPEHPAHGPLHRARQPTVQDPWRRETERRRECDPTPRRGAAACLARAATVSP